MAQDEKQPKSEDSDGPPKRMVRNPLITDLKNKNEIIYDFIDYIYGITRSKSAIEESIRVATTAIERQDVDDSKLKELNKEDLLAKLKELKKENLVIAAEKKSFQSFMDNFELRTAKLDSGLKHLGLNLGECFENIISKKYNYEDEDDDDDEDEESIDEIPLFDKLENNKFVEVGEVVVNVNEKIDKFNKYITKLNKDNAAKSKSKSKSKSKNNQNKD